MMNEQEQEHWFNVGKSTGLEYAADTLLAAVADALPGYIDCAQAWHRQAGGYTASDTALVIIRMKRVAKQVADWKDANARLDRQE